MKCPGRKEKPQAWFTTDEADMVTAYLIRNPLGGGARWAVLPMTDISGVPVISFTDRRPTSAQRFVCPIQNDEAYEEVAEAVVSSAIAYGYFPDTSGPLNQPEDDGD